MEVTSIIAGVLIGTGCFLLVVASIGVLRFPDFYSRLHPAGKGDTLGQALILLGFIVFEGFSMVSLKMFFIMVFIFIANPTATHALVKAAYVAGLRPWSKEERYGTK
ncbi:monovalent cation/H(+) antiporter subunit G [Elusimicrobiota bacterium]